MPRITERQLPGIHVEYTGKHRNEHIRVVIFSNGVVKTANDIDRRFGVVRHDSEQSSCYSHNERCRNALSRYVGNDKIQFVVAQEEVVEVATHLLCRIEESIEVKLFAIRERREDFRYQTHLNTVGDRQFALDAFLGDSSNFQFLDMFLQRALHVGKGIVQLLQVILRVDFRQFGREIPPCNLICSFSKFLYRFSGVFHELADADAQHYQSYDEYHKNIYSRRPKVCHNIAVSVHAAYRPVGALQSRKAEEHVIILDFRAHSSTFAGNHSVSDVVHFRTVDELSPHFIVSGKNQILTDVRHVFPRLVAQGKRVAVGVYS